MESNNPVLVRPKLEIKLTTNQKEILKLLADGKSQVEIAEMLETSVVNINQRCWLIYNKLGCKSATGAVAFALRRNIIS